MRWVIQILSLCFTFGSLLANGKEISRGEDVYIISFTSIDNNLVSAVSSVNEALLNDLHDRPLRESVAVFHGIEAALEHKLVVHQFSNDQKLRFLSSLKKEKFEGVPKLFFGFFTQLDKTEFNGQKVVIRPRFSLSSNLEIYQSGFAKNCDYLSCILANNKKKLAPQVTHRIANDLHIKYDPKDSLESIWKNIFSSLTYKPSKILYLKNLDVIILTGSWKGKSKDTEISGQDMSLLISAIIEANKRGGKKRP